MVNELDRLRKEKREAESNGQWKEAAAICNYIGQELCKLGQYEDALRSHEEELEYCTMTGDELGKAVANRRIGECYCEMANFKDALLHQNIFLNIAVQQKSTVEEQRAWATLGRTYYLKYLHEISQCLSDITCQKSLQKAEQAFLKAIELAECLRSELTVKEYAEMRSRLLLNIGLVYEQRRELTKCAESICHAIFLTKKYNLYEDLHRCQFSLASVYQRCNKYHQALRLLDESISSAKLLHDKALVCEAMVAKASMLLYLKDFANAKKYLKKAYRLHSPIADDHQKTEKQLKIVAGICICEKRLLNTKDLSTRKLLFEKIGDGLSSLECYKLATDYYFSSLKCLEEMDASPVEKAAIYYSIAQTYADDKNYTEAMKYFKIEFECNHGRPVEQIKTLWKIAEIEEEQSDSEKAEEIYLEALRISESHGKKEQIIQSLKKLKSYYDLIGDSSKSHNIEGKLSGFSENDSGSSDEESELLESEQLFSDVNLSDLSDSTDSEAETEYSDVRKKRRSKRPEEKKNELGETPLHRACITGNLKLAKQLVETGHPVNARDNCGWLPLHEACNHGYLEIVEYLLSKGALINDRGGKLCEGVTPLHDAASCGNLDVMELLISKGASVTALNNHGETPLDSFLKWWDRSKNDLDNCVIQQCNAMKAKLKTLMKLAGHNTETCVAEDSEPASPVQGTSEDAQEMEDSIRSDKRQHSSSSSNSSEDESLDVYNNPHVNWNQECDFSDKNAAKSEYKAVMSSLRRSAVNPPPVLEPEKPKPQPLSALLDEEDVVSDWLINDAAKKRQKKKPRKIWKPDSHRNYRPISSYLTERDSDDEKIPSASSSSSVQKPNATLEAPETLNETPCAVNPVPTTSHASVNNNQCSLFCLRIEICNKIILVPVPDDSATVGWLAEEGAKRYFSLTGNRPHLSLVNKDGALLAPNDLIKNVLQNNEKISAHVESWDQTSATERYRQYCNKNGVSVSSILTDALSAFETTSELNFSKFMLPGPQITGLLSCLPHCSNLISLNLSHMDMDENHVQQFVLCLPSFTALVSLDLSLCGLSSLSLEKISDSASNQQCSAFLPKLRHLNLSYNNFGPKSSTSFAVILECIPLETLYLCSCGITASFFSNRKFCNVLSSSPNLKEFDVSVNDLDEAGISELFSSLPRCSLGSLVLNRCLVENRNFINVLGNYMSGGLQFLSELHLEDCYLSDSDVLRLGEYVKFCPKLDLCNLSCNCDLTVCGISKFVEAVNASSAPLTKLLMCGCFCWSHESLSDFVDILKSRHFNKLIVDEIPEGSEMLVLETWKEQWGSRAVWCNSMVCVLSVDKL